MTTTLTYGTESVDLPEGLYWSDEMLWQPVVQAAERTIEGALVIQSANRIGGRPVTLKPDSDKNSWFLRSVLEKLHGWASVHDCTMTLSYRGTDYNVVWRHYEGSVIQSKPVVHFTDVIAGDWYNATLLLMEI